MSDDPKILIPLPKLKTPEFVKELMAETGLTQTELIREAMKMLEKAIKEDPEALRLALSHENDNED